MPGLDLEFEFSYLSIKLLEVLEQPGHEMPKYTGQGITGKLEQSRDPRRDVADPLRDDQSILRKQAADLVCLSRAGLDEALAKLPGQAVFTFAAYTLTQLRFTSLAVINLRRD